MYRVRFEEDLDEDAKTIDAFDPESAAGEFCERSDFCEGIPREIFLVVMDDADATCRVRVTHDWSPTFYAQAITDKGTDG